VLLSATFFSMADQNLNCAMCLKKNSEKIRNERKGCNEPLPSAVGKHRNLYSFFRCPSSLKSKSYQNIIELHEQFDKGLLPFSGGILDQPYKLVEIMSYVADLKSEHYNDLKKQAEKKQARTRAKNGR